MSWVFGAMADNVHGSGNVAVGDSAGRGGSRATLTSISVRSLAQLLHRHRLAESETIRIGDVFNTACFIGGISGQTASGGVAVFIDGKWQSSAHMTSSARFKDEIKPMDKASESVLAL